MRAVLINRLLILFATLGMVIAGLLWVSHSTGYALPCTGTGCDEVARSPYARFLGIPTAAYGFFYFGLLVVLALSRLQYPEQWMFYARGLAMLSTLGMLAFGYLTYLQLFVLGLYQRGSPCWWCLGAASCNLLVWLLSLMGLRAQPAEGAGWARELLKALVMTLLLIVAGFAFGAWQWMRATTPSVANADTARLKLLYQEGQGWRTGNPKAPLIIVEFSDFQCPACKQAYDILEKQFMPKYRNKVLFIFRHYPLVEVHPMAWIAASAAEEAGAQGKFWEMYHALFQSQEDMTPRQIEHLAKTLKLDAQKVYRAMQNKDIYFEKIYRDLKEGSALGVNSTPTFFVVFNGKIRTARGFGALMSALNEPEIQAYLGEKFEPKVRGD
ncbi:Disulfide bond formation protein D [bacterium HR15]|nr:Disulfide bond formation protein D [bacterium HR15]